MQTNESEKRKKTMTNNNDKFEGLIDILNTDEDNLKKAQLLLDWHHQELERVVEKFISDSKIKWGLDRPADTVRDADQQEMAKYLFADLKSLLERKEQ